MGSSRHVSWHQALSAPCWCGEQHDPWEAFALNADVTGEDAPPGQRTFRYLNGRRHALGSLPYPVEPRPTLIRVVWKAVQNWRRARRGHQEIDAS